MNDNSIDLSEIDENEILNIPLKNEDYDFKNRLKENGFDFISNNTEYTSAFPSVILNTIGHISSASYQNKKRHLTNQLSALETCFLQTRLVFCVSTLVCLFVTECVFTTFFNTYTTKGTETSDRQVRFFCSV